MPNSRTATSLVRVFLAAAVIGSYLLGLVESYHPSSAMAAPLAQVTATPTSPAVTSATATPLPTGTPTPTPAGGANAQSSVVNGGFESGTLDGWQVCGTGPAPSISTTQKLLGNASARLGWSGTGPEPSGDSALCQMTQVPPFGGRLTFSYWAYSADVVYYDWQEIQIRDQAGNRLAYALSPMAENSQEWVNASYNLAAYAGRTIQLYINVHEDGYGDPTYMFVDDVAIKNPPTTTPTPSSLCNPNYPSYDPNYPTNVPCGGNISCNPYYPSYNSNYPTNQPCPGSVYCSQNPYTSGCNSSGYGNGVCNPSYPTYNSSYPTNSPCPGSLYCLQNPYTVGCNSTNLNCNPLYPTPSSTYPNNVPCAGTNYCLQNPYGAGCPPTATATPTLVLCNARAPTSSPCANTPCQQNPYASGCSGSSGICNPFYPTYSSSYPINQPCPGSTYCQQYPYAAGCSGINTNCNPYYPTYNSNYPNNVPCLSTDYCVQNQLSSSSCPYYYTCLQNPSQSVCGNNGNTYLCNQNQLSNTSCPYYYICLQNLNQSICGSFALTPTPGCNPYYPTYNPSYPNNVPCPGFTYCSQYPTPTECQGCLIPPVLGMVGLPCGTPLPTPSPLGPVPMSLSPASSTVPQGGTFSIDVRVGSTNNISIVGAQIHLIFDPFVLQVVDTDPSEDGVQITAGTIFGAVLQNRVDNTSGNIYYAAGTFGAASTGPLTLASITFRAIGSAGATTQVRISTDPPSATELVSESQTISVTPQNGIYTIGASTTLQGSVTVRGQSSSVAPLAGATATAGGQLPLSVSFYSPGQTKPVLTSSISADANGHFRVEGVSSGTYDIEVKHPQSLSRKATGVTFAAGSTTTRDFGTLLMGDVDNNNLIDLVDFSLLRAVFGSSTSCASGGNIPCADLDATGQVDVIDFSLLRSNFGSTGPLPAS